MSVIDRASPGGAVKRLGVLVPDNADLRLWAGLAGLVALLVPLAAVVYPLAALAAIAGVAVLALRHRAVLLAFSISGFFVYLGVLDLAGTGPRTAITGPYYAVLGLFMLAAAWPSREAVVTRVRSSGRVGLCWVASAALLGAWFLANGLLYRAGGTEALKMMAIYAGATVPAVILALTLRRAEFEQFRRALVALGLAFVGAEIVAAIAGSGSSTERFTPIAHLDPISAGIVPAIATCAALAHRPATRRAALVQIGLVALLLAGSLISGSRGPGIAALGALAVAAVLTPRAAPRFACAAALGIVLGIAGAGKVGSDAYLRQGASDVVGAVSGDSSTSSGHPISSFHLRYEWTIDALHGVKDAPVFGHGLVALPDTTREARRMGVYGQRIYPHNDLVEALYSLGILGFLLLVAFLLSAIAGAILVWRRHRGSAQRLALVLLTYFLLESNFSGEIGTDIGLWTTSALIIALLAVSPETRAEESTSATS